MSMGLDNPLCLRYHGRFYTGVISKFHQQLVSKRILGICISNIVRMRTIWDEVFFKIRLCFYDMVRTNKLF